MESSYLTYLVISVAVTVWVATTLGKRGFVFLLERYANRELAEAFSHLLSVGFYLLHVGCILIALPYGGHAVDVSGAIELVSTKIGIVLLVLAASHFTHLAVYSKMHRNRPRNPLPTGREPVEAEMMEAV